MNLYRLRCLAPAVAGLLVVLGGPLVAHAGSSAPVQGNSTAGAVSVGPIPDDAFLEARGAVIGEIILEKHNVFDTSQPGENKSVFRFANRWHVITRDAVIMRQLLFRTGDRYERRLLDESERILRANEYLHDASIEPVRYQDGVVDLRVRTRDVWTLTPNLSVSRSGGKNKTEIGIEELNLAGTGAALKLGYKQDVDRDSTVFEYENLHLGGSWLALDLLLADSSDGSTGILYFARPFYALDTRRAGGITLGDDERIDSYYALGEKVGEFRVDRQFVDAFGGWSRGLVNGWTRRWTAGFVFDRTRFSSTGVGTLPVPVDRELVYPFLGYELLEDRYSKTENLEYIGRTEDVYLGTRWRTRLGWLSEGLGADRDGLIYNTRVSMGFGSPEKNILLLNGGAAGRRSGGASQNLVMDAGALYFHRQSEKRSFYATLRAARAVNPDLDRPVELGGNTGLRGYPLRYQRGDALALLTFEQRYYTDWYPFRIFRVGGAVFADVGRTWGPNPVGVGSSGLLKDVGIGLRLVPTRGSPDKVVHIDLAFPLDGNEDINNMQFLIETKRGF